MDKISIILCTYNGEKYLDEQISSIVNQSYSNFELIISDDASADGTLPKLKQWVEKENRIKLFVQEKNLGFNANFEYALRQASGALIAISDQDDIWHPEKIEKMLHAWKPSFPIIHCDSQRFTGTVLSQSTRKSVQRRFEGTDSKKLFFYNSINGHAMMIRRSFLNTILPFEEGIYYDWWTAFVASCNGGVDYLDETLVFQRVHDRNASIDKNDNKKESFKRYREQVRRHIRKFITAPNISTGDKQLGQRLYDDLSSLDSPGRKIHIILLIMRHRKLLFYHKKRKIGFFSHLKHAVKWAFI